MEKIKRVLVAVDLTEMDERLVRFVHTLSKNIKLEKIYFFNVMKNMEVPEKVAEKYPDLMAPMDEAATREIQYTVDNALEEKINADYEIKVEAGHLAEQIMKWAKIKEVDLIMMGRKSTLKGHGIVSGKVVRMAPCSVLFVPENLPNRLEKILVPIDYSDSSKLALEFSQMIASKNEGVKLTCLNIFDVPTGYSYSGKSYDEFAEIMKKNSKDTFKEFISKYDKKDVEIDVKFVIDEKGNIAEKIYNFAVKENPSVLAIGSRGRTKAAAMLIGSIAEKLIKINTKIPMIVVKHKNQNMDFIDALKNI
jgi:nucleotide-binding universal stress UspA family protein